MAIILTRGQARRLQNFMAWAIADMQHKADELNPDNYSPELKEGMELQKLINEQLESDCHRR